MLVLQRSCYFHLPSSLVRRAAPWRLRRFCSSKEVEPLRVLFCGSDDFSIASLRAVNQEREENAELIESVDVLHRPGKRTGRGLKTIREVPIKAVAQELHLSTHEIDTFTGWTPPKPYNLIVAVSFGLFVPPRILNGARYGGLNVHPSLLPDLYGAAPIHHTLLQGDRTTGISVQTLHHKHFDQGVIVAQTPQPGLNVPNPDSCTPAQLIDYLAPIGGSMLVQVLRDRHFLPQLKQESRPPATGTPRHASKITKEDSHVDIKTWPSDRITRTLRVLGDLWDTSTYAAITGKDPKRIVIHAVSVEQVSRSSTPSERPQAQGAWWVDKTRGSLPALATTTCDGKVLYIESCTVEGQRKGDGTRLLARAIDQLKTS